jgi:hypothetical protein
LVAIALVAIQLASAQPAPTTGAAGDIRPGAAIMLTRTDLKDDGARPLLVLVSFANLGDSPLYVTRMDNPNLQLVDEGGNPVGGKVLEDPRAPSKEWYMMKEGKSVLMRPVWRLDPKAGIVRVVPDALAGYPTPLPLGRYQLRLPMKALKAFSEKQVVRRTDVKHELWVEADARGSSVETAQNSVSFKSSGNGDNARKPREKAGEEG